MKLVSKFNLVVISVFLVGLGITAWISWTILQQNARNEIVERAGLMMEAALARQARGQLQVASGDGVENDGVVLALHAQRLDVGKGATLGANCTVVCGVTIGRYAFVGAGAVVTRDIPDYAVVFGTPARHRGWMCECGEKLSFADQQAECSCGKSYEQVDDEKIQILIV